jgi:hypothetical protein
VTEMIKLDAEVSVRNRQYAIIASFVGWRRTLVTRDLKVMVSCDRLWHRTRGEHWMDNFVSWYHTCFSCGWDHVEQQSVSNAVKSELLVFEFKITQNYELVLDPSSCTYCRENERDQFAYYDYRLLESF